MLMIVKGNTNREISEKLCLSPKTTSTYRYRLFDKLGVFNEVEFVITSYSIHYTKLYDRRRRRCRRLPE